jgi:hypothetical protein
MNIDLLLIDPEPEQREPTRPEFTSWHAFIVWAVMRGHAPPERLTESILADVEGAS